MRKSNKYTSVVFLIIASLLAACSQQIVLTAEPSEAVTAPPTMVASTGIPPMIHTYSITPQPLPTEGSLAPGNYYFPKRSISDFKQIIITLPNGWATKGGFVYKNLGRPDEMSISVWVPDQVYADPCHWQTSALSPLDLSNHSHDPIRGIILSLENGGLANQALRGALPRALTTVTIGSEIAVRIDLSVPADLDISTCDQGEFRTWTDASFIDGANFHNAPGQLDMVYMVDLDRKPLVINASYMPECTEADLAELDAILASMVINRGDQVNMPAPIPLKKNLEEQTDVIQGTWLDPGIYEYLDIDGQGFNVRFTVPSGWTWNGRYLSKGGFDQPDRADIFFYGGPAQVYADPCQWGGEAQTISTFRVGDGAMKKLMTALVNQPMRSATTPIKRSANSSGLVNRWPGMAVELTTRDDFNLNNCYGAQYRSWGPEINFRSHVDPGQHDFVWALDTTPPGPGGLIIDAVSFPGTPDDVMSEIEAILDSIVVGHWG